LTRSKFGYYVYAIGGDESATRLAGVNVRRVRTLVYVISGTLAAIVAVLPAEPRRRIGAAVGRGRDHRRGAAAGGQGSLVGVMLGVILLAVLSNGLNMINMSSYVQLVAIGLIVMVASVGSVIRGRRDEE
jgi:ribose transport system permease protein